ncbi:MAG TPA: hypothetical protein VKV15_05715 [Bryobacteraceae bacterium]|nr:hypothetical protein [Bryobacteraceae bacterium]
MQVNVCLYCKQQISFLGRLRGKTRFCSKEHRALYEKETEHLALESIRLARAAPGEPAPLPLASQVAGTVSDGIDVPPFEPAESEILVAEPLPDPHIEDGPAEIALPLAALDRAWRLNAKVPDGTSAPAPVVCASGGVLPLNSARFQPAGLGFSRPQKTLGVLASHVRLTVPIPSPARLEIRPRALLDTDSVVMAPSQVWAVPAMPIRLLCQRVLADAGLILLSAPALSAIPAGISAQVGEPPSAPAVRLPRLPAISSSDYPPRPAGIRPVSLAPVVRLPIRRLDSRVTIRVEVLTADIMLPVAFDTPGGAPGGSPEAAPGTINLSEAVRIEPVLTRPEQTERFLPPRIGGVATSGLFVPQLRVGPLRPRIAYDAQDAESSSNAQKVSRRGSVIPISDLREAQRREAEKPARIRGLQGGKG